MGGNLLWFLFRMIIDGKLRFRKIPNLYQLDFFECIKGNFIASRLSPMRRLRRRSAARAHPFPWLMLYDKSFLALPKTIQVTERTRERNPTRIYLKKRKEKDDYSVSRCFQRHRSEVEWTFRSVNGRTSEWATVATCVESSIKLTALLLPLLLICRQLDFRYNIPQREYSALSVGCHTKLRNSITKTIPGLGRYHRRKK